MATRRSARRATSRIRCTSTSASRLAKLKARPDALLGRVFDGRYEIKAALGQGGMGTVYRGWQLSVDREVAIKVIHPKLASDRIAVKRFLREVRLASRLNPPTVVNVYDSGHTEDGILYLVMELLRGHTLARELEAMRALPVRRVVTIALQLCDALDSAHAQQIIHRDLKPGNIVILDDPPGRDLIKVLDFGLAKTLVAETTSLVTQTDAVLGTPLYMAPEQIESKATDHRADLYALGCILYQMVSGRPPFLGDNPNAVLAKHLSEVAPVLPDGVPEPLAGAIAKLMEKDPARRTASAAAVRTALHTVADSGFVASTDVADTTPDIVDSASRSSNPLALAETDHAHRIVAPASSLDVQPPPRRRIAPLVVAVLALLAVVGFGVVVMTRERGGTTTPDAARQPATPATIDSAPAPDVPIATTPVDAAVDAVPAAVIDAPPRRKPPRPPPDDGLDFQRPKRR
jgi:serine/threonine-protein kinase